MEILPFWASRVNPERDVVKGWEENAYSLNFKASRIFIVNKPKGFTCSNDDPHAHRLIFELTRSKASKHHGYFVQVGWIVDSEGLVILTNDGNLAHKLTHPSQQVRKNIR